MSRRKKDPLRELTEQENSVLDRLSRSTSSSAAVVTRSKVLLCVASGQSYTEAAVAVGRKTPDAVSRLVSRFNEEGLSALEPRHGGGPPVVYDEKAKERILQEARRPPDRERDGTAVWTLSTLRRALRKAEDGLPSVSTYTLWKVLSEEGKSPQKDRTWCTTGTVLRKRKSGTALVTDPDTQAKKN